MSESGEPTPEPVAFDRRPEVERLLGEDDSVLGQIWRYEQEGLSLHEMAEREGVTTSPIYSARSLIRVLRDGYLPTGPTVAAQSAARVRAWLKTKDLSGELRDAFIEQEALLMSRAEDQQAQTEEVAVAVKVTMAAEATGVPGIYVYTLPHYLRHPFDSESGRTLLKVGHSSVDALYRAGSQGRLTALPEDPILLRIYPAEESAHVEGQFHTWLRDADHPSSRTRRGGSEWFVTSTKFLDRVARSMGLEVRVVNEFEAGEE